jgi:hypothetical protein
VATPEPRKLNLAAGVVASNLRVDSMTAEVLRAFEAEGIESLLLKGASVARWLYDNEEPRGYADCDLLVGPRDLDAAENVLVRLRFEPEVDRTEMPDWWQEHAIGWLRPDDGAVLDLHRTLPGVGVDPEQLWLTLAAYREPLAVGGTEAQTLTIPGRAFMLALHAGHHGTGWGRFLDDLERGISVTDLATWRAAAELAALLEATAAFATGLRLVERGHAIASELRLPTDESVDLALKASTPPPIALGFDQLARASGWRERLTILRHKFFPPVTFMKRWSPLARRGRLGLLRAYAQRGAWLLRNAPAGFRAWRSARRSSSAD